MKGFMFKQELEGKAIGAEGNLVLSMAHDRRPRIIQ
jgi:hypothetical protein